MATPIQQQQQQQQLALTYAQTADEHDEEALSNARLPHRPGQPNEQDDPDDILDARQVHAHNSAQLGLPE